MKIYSLTSLLSFYSLQLIAADDIKVQNLDTRVAALEEQVDVLNDRFALPQMQHPDTITNVHVYGDFLYWYSQLSDLGYAMAVVQSPDGSQAVPQQIKYPDFTWEPGFRIGVGFNSGMDHWTFGFDWLHIRSTARNSASRNAISQDPNTEYFLTTWSSGLSNQLANVFTTKATGDLNQIDIIVSRAFMPTQNLAIKPIIGIFGSRFDISYDIHATSTFSNTDLYDAQDDQIHVAQDYKGAGPTIGSDIEWMFNKNVALVGSLSFGVLLSDFDVSFKETLTDLVDEEETSMHLKSEFYATQLVVDALIGLRVGAWFTNQTQFLSFLIAWEGLYYPNHIKFPKIVDPVSHGNFVQVNGDVSFGGLTLRAQFDF